jgi:HEAT repeat protein
MAEENLVDRVVGILGNQDGIERVRALAELRESAALDTLDALIASLNSSDEQLRRRAGSSISLFRDVVHSRSDALAEYLQSGADPRVRLSCAIALMPVSSAAVDAAYLKALTDSSDKVVQIACLEIGSRKAPEGVEALKRVLSHPAWRVRLEACKGLIRQNAANRLVVSTLEAMGNEPEAAVYDAEDDQFQQIERELGETPLLDKRWGKLGAILAEARQVANQIG